MTKDKAALWKVKISKREKKEKTCSLLKIIKVGFLMEDGLMILVTDNSQFNLNWQN